MYNRLKIPQGETRKVRERLAVFVTEQLALDLIDKLLTLDPKQRIDADNAVSSDFFYSDPPIADLKPLLSKCQSMFELHTASRSMNNQQAQQRPRTHRPNVPNLPAEPIY